MERLKILLDGKGEFIEYGKDVKSLKESGADMGIDKSLIVKSIVYVSKEGKPLIGVLRINDRVSTRKFADALKLGKRPKIAGPEEVLKLIGYEAGAVPPVTEGVSTVIDERVMDEGAVYGGGGSKTSLLKIEPRLIQKLTNAIVADIIDDAH